MQMGDQLKYWAAKGLYLLNRKEAAKGLLEGIDSETNFKVKKLLVKTAVDLGNKEEAVKHLKQAAKIPAVTEGHKRILKTQIEVLIEVDDYKQGLIILEDELKREQDKLGINAAVAFLTRDFKPLKQSAERILNREADHPQASFVLGAVYYKEEKYNQAVEHYKKAYQKNLNPKISLSGIVGCYLELGELDKAAEWLEEMGKDYEYHLTTLFNKACLNYKRGELKEALKMMENLKLYVDEGHTKKEVFYDFYKQIQKEAN